MTYLSETSLEKMCKLLSSEAFEALDMVDRQCKAIDWQRWSLAFYCLEALGLIEESHDTQFNAFVHTYTFTKLGATLWKFKVTQMQSVKKPWWHSLTFSKKSIIGK